jgi:hypothetical protein
MQGQGDKMTCSRNDKLIWPFHHPVTLSPCHPATLSTCLAGFTALVLLAACAGGRPTATPLSPDVVRPVQPTPVYANATVFSLATPPPAVMATPGVERPPALASNDAAAGAAAPQPEPILWPQPPSALGIVRGGVLLLDRPDGSALLSLPAGATLTVTGKTADGRFVAAYTDDGIAGWIGVGQVSLFGADDLLVISSTTGPGPIATLIARAMTPVKVLETLVATPDVQE